MCHEIEIFAGVYFCVLAIFSVFAIRTDWFYLLGINFCDFQKVLQYQALITFSFLLSTSNRNTYFQAINQYFVYFVVSE